MSIGSVGSDGLVVNDNYGGDSTPPVGPIPDAVSSINAAPSINTITPHAILLQNATISILAFAHTITSALDGLKQALNANELADINGLRELSADIVGRLANLSTQRAALQKYYDDLKAILDARVPQLSNFNNQISNYSNAFPTINSAVQDMNTAIDTFNAASGLDPNSQEYMDAETTYNAAVDSYNDSVNNSFSSTVNTFNSSLSAYQDQITQANADLVHVNAAGAIFVIPSVSNFSTAQQPKSIELATHSPTGVSGDIPHVTNPGGAPALESSDTPLASFDTYIALYFQSQTAQTTQAVIGAVASMAALIRDLDFRLYNRKGTSLNPTVADAYISRAPPLFVQSATGAGAGASLSSILGGLSTPTLERLVSLGLFASAIQDENIQLTAGLKDTLIAFDLAFYNILSLLGGKLAAGLLADSLGVASPNGNAAEIALIAGFIKAATLFVGSGGEVLVPQISDILQEALGIDKVQADQLAGIIADIFSISTLFIALSGLGEALGIPNLAEQIIGALPEGGGLVLGDGAAIPTDAFHDTLQRLLLKSVLLDVGKTYFASEGQATQVINDTIDKVALELTNNASESDIHNALEREFLAKGLSQEAATKLADTTTQFIRGDTSLSLFAPATTSAQAAAPTAGIITGTPATSLTTAPTSGSTVAGVVGDRVIALLTPEIGETAARRFAESLLPIIDPRFPNSAASLINLRLESFRHALGEAKFKAAVEQLRVVFSRHVDPVILLNRFLDPGNNLLMSFMVGLMYNVNIPTNWQRPLSVQV